MTAADLLTDRAAAALVASACGDALGAGYEFAPASRIPALIGMHGGGSFGWEPGEWTDDTSMAWVVAQVAAAGADLRSQVAQDEVAAGWFAWMSEAKDVGTQTRSVLRAGAQRAGVPTAEDLLTAATSHHEYTGRSAGNGSLMRTAPVALAYLDDPVALTQAATQISQLTHYDPEASEACVLHCQAIRHAVLTTEIDPAVGLPWLSDSPRLEVWRTRIADIPTHAPADYANNYWAVEAFLAAWSAISAGHGQVVASLEAAVRGGDDTDTVACIAGAVVGAARGMSAIPAEWIDILHGWPGRRASDLVDLATQIVQGPVLPV